MTEQQPQEPYGDPQYESYREVMPTEPSPVVPSSVMPTSPIPASSMSQPTESVPTTSMPTESIPTTGASGPTGASRQHQAPQPHTPIRILFSRAAPTSGPYAPGPFPTPEARATQAHTKRPPHGPGRPTAHHRRHHPRSPRAETNRQAHPPYQPYPMPPYQQYRPMQPPRKTGIGAGGITR